MVETELARLSTCGRRVCGVEGIHRVACETISQHAIATVDLRAEKEVYYGESDKRTFIEML